MLLHTLVWRSLSHRARAPVAVVILLLLGPLPGLLVVAGHCRCRCLFALLCFALSSPWRSTSSVASHFRILDDFIRRRPRRPTFEGNISVRLPYLTPLPTSTANLRPQTFTSTTSSCSDHRAARKGLSENSAPAHRIRLQTFV